MDCIEQNGDITGYLVQYGVEGSRIIQGIYLSGRATTETTIFGLYCYTNYTLQVAAVNSAGIGVYSNALSFITEGIAFMLCC